MNKDYLVWFSINQFIGEAVGAFFVVVGGLLATAFALNKFKGAPFTFSFANSLVILLAPLIAFIVLLILNEFTMTSLPIVSPVTIVANIINAIITKELQILNSLLYIILAQMLGTLLGVLCYNSISDKYQEFKMHKDPIDKGNVRSSIFREVSYIALFTGFLIFNRIMIYQKNNLNFFVYNLMNSVISFLFLVSAYKHGYFTTNFYALIGHNILLKVRRLNNTYTVSHCLASIFAYIIFSIVWAAVILTWLK